MSRAILVTGATGFQGSAVIDALLAQDLPSPFLVLAATRNARSPAATRLAAKSPRIKLVEGDMNRTHDLFAAAKSAASAAGATLWGVYSVQVFHGKGASLEGETAQAKAVVDEALAAGVGFFVYGSVERGGDERSWHNPTGVPHFRGKLDAERYLRDKTASPSSSGNNGASAMKWTILRPVIYWDNLGPDLGSRVFLTMMRDVLRGKPVQWVAARDIGVAAAAFFRDPETWGGRAVGVASQVLTHAEMDAAFREVVGRPLPTTFGFLGRALRAGLFPGLPAYGRMAEWFREEGFAADMELNRGFNPAPMTFGDWLRGSGFVRGRSEVA
ncbi:hypothetical protein N3K66_006257 [Trichothecium roseum]|uniref:Uncharacterized protein n=1 Tax=Trichothecium roseum TaxID=47278 RepID=A0ACC0V0A5_9HYPO|nr:hypothetical protein N3K66_006257 [Trichothecium roseum]